mgnify:CR=1 FL=1
MNKALEGIRVIDIGQLVQGPQAGATLADMGAQVIKIELPMVGDLSRWIDCSPEDNRNAYYVACNRGKQCMTLISTIRSGQRSLVFQSVGRCTDRYLLQ